MIEPIKESVKAKGHTAQYKMHKYFARRPYNVFSNLVNYYTQMFHIRDINQHVSCHTEVVCCLHRIHGECPKT